MRRTLTFVVLAILVAATLVLLRRSSYHQPSGNSTGPSWNAATSTPSPTHYEDGPKNTETGPTPTTQGAAWPERPAFLHHTPEELQAFGKFLSHGWAISANETLAEVDALCATKGAKALLELVRREAFSPDFTSPAYLDDGQDGELKEVGPEVMKVFDFRAWFRRLQLVRLIPYALQKQGDADDRVNAIALLFRIMKEQPDPIMQRFAAAAFSDRESFALPTFQALDPEHKGLYGIALRFVGDARGDGQDFGEAGQTVDALTTSLLPAVRNDAQVTGAMVDAIEARRDPWSMTILLHAVPQMGAVQQYAPALSRLAHDPTLPQADVMQLEVITVLAQIGQADIVRDIFASTLAHHEPVEVGVDSQDWFQRVSFLEKAPSMYPRDPQLAQNVASFVTDARLDADTRDTAAQTLANYYAQGLRNPEFKEALDAYLVEQAHGGNWGTIGNVWTEVVNTNTREDFVGVFKRLLEGVQQKSFPATSREETITKLQGYVDALQR